MPVAWKIRDRLLLVTVLDQSCAGLTQAVLEGMASPGFCPGMSLLFDVRLSDGNPTSEELRMRAAWLATLVTKGISARCAVVVNSQPYQYGLARMAATHLDFQGVHLEIFQGVEEASTWLSCERAAGAS